MRTRLKEVASWSRLKVNLRFCDVLKTGKGEGRDESLLLE